MDNIDSAPGWRIAIPLICLAFGALLAGGAALWLLSSFVSAPNWATTQGEIVSAGIDRRETVIHQSSRQGGSYRQTRYSADIVYHYRVRGRDYTGFGIGDGVDWNHSSQSSARAALGAYGGGSVTVYYDPANPERSALDPSVLSSVPLVIGGIGLLLLGAGYMLRRAERARAQAEAEAEAEADVETQEYGPSEA